MPKTENTAEGPAKESLPFKTLERKVEVDQTFLYANFRVSKDAVLGLIEKGVREKYQLSSLYEVKVLFLDLERTDDAVDIEVTRVVAVG